MSYLSEARRHTSVSVDKLKAEPCYVCAMESKTGRGRRVTHRVTVQHWFGAFAVSATMDLCEQHAVEMKRNLT